VATLSGMQKAATILLQLGPQRASRILKAMTESEVIALTSAVANLPPLGADDVAQVVAEFIEDATRLKGVAQGGLAAARALLEAKVGPKEAAELLAQLQPDQLPPVSSVDPLSFLAQVPQNQLSAFLSEEHPQTIAVILSHLQPELAARVLADLPEAVRVETAQRIALMQRVAPEVIDLTASVLRRKLADLAIEAQGGTENGISTLAEILNRADRQTERGILAALDERDPELADQVRNQLFVFDDVAKLDDRTLQVVLRHVVPGELALALKTVGPEVRQKFLSNMSERAAADLVEEMELLGPVRMSQVEAAQAAVVRVVRELDAQGEIVLAREEDELVV
jgi:flagellar motor switch protein FliG